MWYKRVMGETVKVGGGVYFVEVLSVRLRYVGFFRGL